MNIDYEHQEIIKNLNKYFDFFLPEKVQNEIRTNAKNKVSSIEVKTKKDKEYKENYNKYIDVLIGRLWQNVSQDQQIEKDLGKNIYKELSKIIGFRKNDGEWYCVAHSLYLSRMCQTRLSLITDDYPAIKKYEGIFESQKIGLIEDSSDFLILLFWNCPEIDKRKVSRYLKDLYSEYKREVDKLLDKIRDFRYYKLTAKDTQLRIKISEFEQALNNLKLDDLNQKKNEILNASGKFKKPLKDLFERFGIVFELDRSHNLLNKIQSTLSYLEGNEIFKVY